MALGGCGLRWQIVLRMWAGGVWIWGGKPVEIWGGVGWVAGPSAALRFALDDGVWVGRRWAGAVRAYPREYPLIAKAR